MSEHDVRPGAAAISAPRQREQLIASTFVQLADTLVDDYDVVDLLDVLVNSCVDLLQVTAVGLLLNDQKGNLAVVASSSEESRLLEVCQLQSDEGPCLECVRSGTVVKSVDLEDDRDRWPVFVEAARQAGFRSVVAVPMRLRELTIGGLNMFHEQPGTMSAEDERLAQALADVATIGILQQRMSHRSALLAEQLQNALNSRVLVEQAKGVLAERHRVNMDTAFRALRRYARDHNRKLVDVAREVVLGGPELSQLVIQPPTS